MVPAWLFAGFGASPARLRAHASLHWRLCRVRLLLRSGLAAYASRDRRRWNESLYLPFFLKSGRLMRGTLRLPNGDSNQFLRATPRPMIASCGAHFVTSSIQGNCSRFTALTWRRSAVSDGRGRAGLTKCPSY